MDHKPPRPPCDDCFGFVAASAQKSVTWQLDIRNSEYRIQNPSEPRTSNGELVGLFCYATRLLRVGASRLEYTRYFFTQPNLDQRLIWNVAFVCRVLYVR